MIAPFTIVAVLHAQDGPLVISSVVLDSTDVVGGSLSIIHGTINIDRGSFIHGPIPYTISCCSFDRLIDFFDCNGTMPDSNSDCYIPEGASSASFRFHIGLVQTDGPGTLSVHLDTHPVEPNQISSQTVNVRAEKVQLRLNPTRILANTPTKVTATMTILEPPAPTSEIDGLFDYDPFFGHRNAVLLELFCLEGRPFVVTLSPEFVVDRFTFQPAFALVPFTNVGATVFTHDFMVTATDFVTQVPFRAALGFNTGDAVLAVGPPQESFRIQIQDLKGNELTHYDTSLPEETAPSVKMKVGELVHVKILPLNKDGTLDPPVSPDEQMTDAVDQSPSDSQFTKARQELFKNQIMVHFPLPTAAPADLADHRFLAVHSGTVNAHFAFINGGKSFAFTVPFRVSNCQAGDCVPQLGPAPDTFDSLLIKFADRNGVPPQLLKAQIAQESSFNPRSFRYEPLSVDFGHIAAPTRKGTVPFGVLRNPAFAPWALAQSSNCATVTVAQGAKLKLGSADATAREKYKLAHDARGSAICRVTSVADVINPNVITAADTLPSMENVLYTNDDDSKSNWVQAASNKSTTAQRFFDYQVDHPPFTAQTVIAASYGLHQLLYETAVGMGFKDAGVGRPPGDLFDKTTSLDLGTEYLASKFHDNRAKGAIEAVDYESEREFFFKFAPALRGFNHGTSEFTAADAEVACTKRLVEPFTYACRILGLRPTYSPVPIAGGGN
ncbi:MAG TPA: hypothetical protein VLV78_22830 [Thermoanaerobaculia bacterium]|nr:hypothetical protein [Thermoanaerobaculia bacterium]